MPSIREGDLPGLGRKFQVEAASGDRLTIVINDDGRRELFHLSPTDPDRVVSSISLTDGEARQVAGIIGGLSYVPKALQSTEIIVDDLVLEWFTIAAGSACIGRTIGELKIRTRTGASVVSIIETDREKRINPGADTVLHAGATLILAGDRAALGALKQLLASGNAA